LFLHSKEDGEKDLDLRKALTAGTNSSNVVESSSSHDPFPIPREDGMDVNPLEPETTPPVTPVIDESRPSSSSPILSPDSSVSHTNQETNSTETYNKHLSKSDSDKGYSSIGRSYNSSIVSPHSVDSALGSDEDSSSPCSSVFVTSHETHVNESNFSQPPSLSSPTASTQSTLKQLLSTRMIVLPI